jgi:hypothetical protein
MPWAGTGATVSPHLARLSEAMAKDGRLCKRVAAWDQHVGALMEKGS